MAAKKFEIGRVRAGDIVFVDTRSVDAIGKIERFVIVYGQRLLAWWRRDRSIPLRDKLPKHSHVMLGLDGGTVIHADGKSVTIEVISEALQHATPAAAK